MHPHNITNQLNQGNMISTDNNYGLKRSKSMSDIRLFDRASHGESTSFGRSVSMNRLNRNSEQLTSMDRNSALQYGPTPDTPLSGRNTVLITIDCSEPEEKSLGMGLTLRYFPFEIHAGDYVKKITHIDLKNPDKELMEAIPEPSGNPKVRIITKTPISEHVTTETASKKNHTVQNYEFNQEESKYLCRLLKNHYKTFKLPYMDCHTFISYINNDVRTYFFPEINKIKREYKIANSDLNRGVDNTGKDITLYANHMPFNLPLNVHSARIINKDELTLSCSGFKSPDLYFVYLDDLFKVNNVLDPTICLAREINFPEVKTAQP